MNILQWMRRILSSPTSPGEADSSEYQLLQAAHARLAAEEYDKARTILLQALQSRGDIKNAATIDYLLMSLG